MKFSSIERAVAALQRGKFIVIVDDEHRENEGDLVIAAEHITSGKINYLLKHGRGLICIAMTGDRLGALDLPQMTDTNTEVTGCAFTISVDAKKGITTGISAADRAATVKTLIDEATKPDDLRRPGHLFPLKGAEGGVSDRPGHTEAIIELCKLGGLYPAGVICEILNDKGDAAKLPELEEFAQQHGLEIISINDLIIYSRKINKEQS